MYRKVDPSPTLLINQQVKQARDRGERIYHMGFGQSPFLPPSDVLSELVRHGDKKQYTSVQGLPLLRERIAAFHYDHSQLHSDPARIFVAPGSKVLLFNILLSYENAVVFLPCPCWVSYQPQVLMAGHQPVLLPTSYQSRWHITAEQLDVAARQHSKESKLLFLNHPGNPDGLSYSEADLLTIVEVARRHQITIISDEIYGLLQYDHQHVSVARLYPEATITTTGMSKWCGAGGWRLGIAMLSEGLSDELVDAMIGIGSETYSCAPVPVQMAAMKAYESYQGRQEYLRRQINILDSLATYVAGQLTSCDVRVHRSEGGFYMFPDFGAYREVLRVQGITSSLQLCQRILAETQVALLPASSFGMRETMAARLAYVDIDPPEDLHSWEMARHAVSMIEGAEALITWLQRL